MSEVLERAYRRVMSLVGRGRVKLVDDTGAAVQLHQVDVGPMGPSGSLGLKDKVPHLAGYGDLSCPPEGTHVVVLFLGGDRTDGVVVASNYQQGRKINLQPGERGLINQLTGAYLLFGATGITLEANGQNVTVQNAPVVTVKSSTKVRLETPRLEVTGDVIDHCDAQSKTLKDLRDAYDAHKHTGVQTGSSSTGLTDHNV